MASEHREAGHLPTLRVVLAAWLMEAGITGTAIAGPLEHAEAAYERGDYATALRMFRPLADQGNSAAQNYLGNMYNLGWGVPQDYTEALRWYRLAADQGDDTSQYSLGLMYANGQGVPRDYVRAHMWLNLAAAQGDYKAAEEERAKVERKMTPAQIAEAQGLAREWKPKPER
jgi:TPR repeat protein